MPIQIGPLTLTTEYQSTVTCSQDPCSYCRAPRKTYVVSHSQGSFPTIQQAVDHARAMARNVYGDSVHFVGVQERLVSQWIEVKP